MNNNRILITGGAGLLGSELSKLLPGAQTPSLEELNLDQEYSIDNYLNQHEVELIIHCAAYMPPQKSDSNPDESIRTNIIGTSLLTIKSAQKDIRLIYISTDYVFKGDKGNYKEDDSVYPINNYAWSKLGGECAVKMYKKGLIVRTTFGKKEFPYPKAFANQYTSKEPVDVFAKKLVSIIDKNITGVIHIGGEKKTIYEYAKMVSPDKEFEKIKIEDMLPDYVLPKDTTLNTDKFDELD